MSQRFTFNSQDYQVFKQLALISLGSVAVMYLTNILANLGLLPPVFTWKVLLGAFSITPMFIAQVSGVVITNCLNVLYRYVGGPKGTAVNNIDPVSADIPKEQ